MHLPVCENCTLNPPPGTPSCSYSGKAECINWAVANRLMCDLIHRGKFLPTESEAPLATSMEIALFRGVRGHQPIPASP